ncbi:polyadenylate-binding protein 2-like [Trifolium pratense]|uniref:Polyadenylate-binding protein 2-like n=1 Tax=Trifolium pratense TaxID=57577 RepID=A0A2K3NHR9_TRIPR|nr:polyadenylate-binding protein 2-like [Trifolium pratense]
MNRQTTTIIIGDLPPSKIISGHHNADLPPSKVMTDPDAPSPMNRVIILTNEFSLPKDCAYVEFLKIDDVPKALLLNESELHGRKIKVCAKCTNILRMNQYSGRYTWVLRSRRPPPFRVYCSDSFSRSALGTTSILKNSTYAQPFGRLNSFVRIVTLFTIPHD